jgi:WD40 repeat protein
MLRVWDTEGHQAPRVLEGHTDSVNAVALTADGKRAVSGSDDNTLRVWDLKSGNCLAVFTCDAPVLCCAWSGDVIAAGDRTRQFHLFAWEA